MELGKIPESEKVASFDELAEKNIILEAELERVLRELYKLRNIQISDAQLHLLMQEQVEALRQAEFGASSERYKKPKKKERPTEPAKPRVKKPSERYPNIPVHEVLIEQNPVPSCPCCSRAMVDSGLTEDAEQLTVIPKKYEILLQKRVKYRCSCHGSLVTAAAPARILPGSSYSDEMILDVALSKYCDLIPMERYAAMAGRGGLPELPPQSLIELTHGLANFLLPAYELIKDGVLSSRVLHADETPHRMLEGSSKKNWYLWGFSTAEHCFFECHSTRSGDVASSVLLGGKCEILVTDVYSGYGKAIGIVNKKRLQSGVPPIQNANCNAHARRYFFKCYPGYKEAEFYLDHYHEIYQLNDKAKGLSPPEILELRSQMKPRFEAMKKQAERELASYSLQGKYGKALRYFLENYDELTLFLADPRVPMDNNSQEQLLRSHVVGRKTWYGTHSKQGAQTAAILFTLVETCKLCDVNPREYFDTIVSDLLAGHQPCTPSQLRNLRSADA